MKTLREVVDQAIIDHNMYRSPDLDEFRERMAPILEVLHQGKIGQYDRITSISEEPAYGVLHIQTAYEVRCCAQEGSFEIPLKAIDAEDPVRTAEISYLNKRVLHLTHDIKSWTRDIEGAKVKLDAFTARLVELSQ